MLELPHAKRLPQAILIVSTVVGSWLGMQAVHESGHVVGAWLTGGQIAKVVLHPLTISRTDLSHNPSPLVVVWAGPMVGVIVPVILWLVVAACQFAGAFLPRFFAGFCLIANGAYIGAGSFGPVGDCQEMLRHGSPIWLLWLFGMFTLPAGLLLWNRQGSHFGLGAAKGQVNTGVAWVSLVACGVLLILTFAVGGE